jgi:uncharacterized protein YbjT (DUF2867 family)
VDQRDVAERLVELALGRPAGLVPDLVGPRTYALDELGRDYLRVVGKRRPRLPIRIPGKTGRLYREGAKLSFEGQTGERSWEDYLEEQASADSANAVQVKHRGRAATRA